MFKIDLHLHTSRYSNCSGLSVEHLAAIAPMLKLDGIVITEHNHQWSQEEIDEIQKLSGPDCRFYRAMEVSCFEGDFLVYGLRDNAPIKKDMPLRELAVLCEEDQAALIFAHPGRFCTAPPDPAPEEWKSVHGVEVMSYNLREEFLPAIFETHRVLNLPQYAGSDSHAAWTPGLYATEFDRMPKDEKDLAAMIRRGEGVPWANLKHLKDIRTQIPEAHLIMENPIQS